MSDVISIIKEHYNKLSKGNKRIADYIVMNTSKSAYMTAFKIGEEVGVSESSVVRFASNIGFSGFPKLQESIIEFVSSNSEKEEKVSVNDLTAHEIMQKDIENIRNTYRELDMAVFSQAVELVEKARKVYVVGVRESAVLAAHMAYYLNYIVDDVVLITSNSSNEIIEGIYKISKKDVMIGISFPNYSYNVLKAMEYANTRQANIIAMTDDKNSPMIMYSSCNIFTMTGTHSISQSLSAPMSIVNLFVTKLVGLNKSKVMKNLNLVNEVLSDYTFVGDDDINMLDDEWDDAREDTSDE